MRKFALRNSIGETFDLNGQSGVFLSNPQGLGYTQSPTFADLGQGFYSDVYSDSPQMAQIVGDLNFVVEPYDKFSQFVNWLNKGYLIEFGYKPGNTEYCRRAEISSLGKGEISRSGVLTCSVVFNTLSPWYKENPNIIQIVPSSDGTKTYTYVYSYRYPQAVRGASAEVEAVGHLDSSIKITMDGPLVNPEFKLKDIDTGNVVGRCKITGNLDYNAHIEFSTLIGNSYIKVNGDDYISHVDITDNVFFRVPAHRGCLLSITSDDTITTNAQLRVYDYYRSV